MNRFWVSGEEGEHTRLEHKNMEQKWTHLEQRAVLPGEEMESRRRRIGTGELQVWYNWKLRSLEESRLGAASIVILEMGG